MGVAWSDMGVAWSGMEWHGVAMGVAWSGMEWPWEWHGSGMEWPWEWHGVGTRRLLVNDGQSWEKKGRHGGGDRAPIRNEIDLILGVEGRPARGSTTWPTHST